MSELYTHTYDMLEEVRKLKLARVYYWIDSSEPFDRMLFSAATLERLTSYLLTSGVASITADEKAFAGKLNERNYIVFEHMLRFFNNPDPNVDSNEMYAMLFRLVRSMVAVVQFQE